MSTTFGEKKLKRKMTTLKYGKLLKYLFLVILFLGFFLRFYQYLMGRSLWEDETHLALNFFNHTLLGLTKPLDDMQGAPVFFLFTVKIIVSVFGYGDLTFRAFPFVASLLTLPLFYYIILSLTSNRLLALTGFFIFCTNVILIYFSSEFKPYAIDVACYLLVVFMTVSPYPFVSRNRLVLLAIVGCLSILYSLSAFIIVFCVACNMILTWIKQKKINTGEIKVMLAWLLVFAGNYFLFIHNHPSTEGQRYNYDSAFCPTDIFSPEFAEFFKKTGEEVFFNALLFVSRDFYFPCVLAAILLIALVRLFIKKEFNILLFTLLPILIHLTLSALKIYPFVQRLILYLVPAMIFLISYGTYYIAEFLARKLHIAAGVAIGCLFCFFLTKESVHAFPLWQREIKPVLNYVNDSLPSAAHVYAADPVNAYTYYYKLGYVRNPVYEKMQWQIDLPEFYDMVSGETSNYILLYGQEYRWGYGDVIEDLKKRNLIVRTFSYKTYAVSEVKPLPSEGGNFTKMLNYRWFDPALIITDEKLVALWGGEIVSRPLKLKRGSYSISIVSNGTPMENIFPHHLVLVNDKQVGDYSSSRWDSRYTFTFEMVKDTSIVIKIRMDNDAASEKEDRNTFIRNIYIMKTDSVLDTKTAN